MIILTTIDNIPNRKIKSIIGVVTGSTVRTTSAREDIMTGLKGLFGGELPKALKIIEEARDEATKRLLAAAKAKDADAVIGIKYSSTSNIFGAVEIFVYGTAVKIE